MVEVDNIQHEQFTVTEEVKVQNPHNNTVVVATCKEHVHHGSLQF